MSEYKIKDLENHVRDLNSRAFLTDRALRRLYESIDRITMTQDRLNDRLAALESEGE